MKAVLRNAWTSRSPRDRAIVIALAIVVSLSLYAALLVGANRARPQLQSSVLALRTDAARLETFAAEVERLRTVRPPTPSQADLRALVQAQAASAGLAGSLVRVDAPDAGRVQVVFGAVAFPDWLNWVAALDAQGIRLESCRVEALSKPGQVSVTAGFVRPGRR